MDNLFSKTNFYEYSENNPTDEIEKLLSGLESKFAACIEKLFRQLNNNIKNIFSQYKPLAFVIINLRESYDFSFTKTVFF
ncbi:hypothetical protein [Spiroplasma melliferum]|uniref:hypothetical protein n=1 Tax=Spiroplasma melliferum TaxID=2134 RepID=UPI003A5C7E78